MWRMVTQLEQQNYSTPVAQAIRVNDNVYSWKRLKCYSKTAYDDYD